MAILAGLAYGVWRRSRVCAVLLLVYGIANEVILAFDETARFSLLRVVFIYFYFRGAIQLFRNHRNGTVPEPARHNQAMRISLLARAVADLCLVRLMKIALRLTFMAMIFSTMLLSSGCEENTDATDPTAQSTPGSTKPLEAADLVGYDGKMLRKSVDRIREGNEKHNQELEKTAGSGPDQ